MVSSNMDDGERTPSRPLFAVSLSSSAERSMRYDAAPARSTLRRSGRVRIWDSQDLSWNQRPDKRLQPPKARRKPTANRRARIAAEARTPR
jgi:hypothetical protein